ncbi:MAG: exo-alpha-sialidase, partial [Chloroflexia bacterium]
LSTNGGTNWTNYQVAGTGGLFYGDPAMTFDHGGYAYFSFLGYSAICTPQGGMYVSRSTDSGATFLPPVQLAQNTGGGLYTNFQDKEYVAVDTNPSSPYSGTVYVGWTKFVFVGGTNCTQQYAAPVVLSRSTDHGISWSEPITASQPISNNNQGTVPVIGLNGDVYLYYVGAATQTQLNYDSVLFSRSTDGGQTFPIFKRVADIVDLPSPLPPTNFRNNPFGAMAADKQIPGYLYAVWADYRNGDADILMVTSTDSGNTWTAPRRVNDDPISNGKDQFFPWITASTDGSIHVGWFDRREDAVNRSYKEYYTVSYDHGLTWEPNIAISTAASNPGNSGFIGDYSGLAAVDGVVIPTWTDIRAGTNQNAYIARGVYSAGPTITPAPTSTATIPPTATATSTSAATSTRTATATSIPSSTPTACTIQFTDVLPGSTFYDFVRCLACRGIINGYTTGCETGNPCFKPNANVTRGQLSKIVSNAAGFSEPAGAQQFEDVLPGSTFYDFVWRLAS